MRVDELPLVNGVSAMLYCPECHAEYPAHAGDYFGVYPDTVMRCLCDGVLELVERITSYRGVK